MVLRGTLGRKMPQILRGWCSEAVPGRKRYLFLRGMGYRPPARQKNAPNPARKVLRGGSRQKKASFPAQNGIPTACRLPPAVTSPVIVRIRGAEPQKTKITIWFVRIADIFYFCARIPERGKRKVYSLTKT